MASLTTCKKTGLRMILVVRGRKRPKIGLGKMTEPKAYSILGHVNALESAEVDDTAPPKATAAWLTTIPEKLHNRLVEIGLTEPRAGSRVSTVGELIDRYKAQKFGSYKPGTIQTHEQTVASLEKHWRRDTPLRRLTAGDAERFRDALRSDKLAEATVRKRCAIASKMMRFAVRDDLMDRNPFEFAGIKMGNIASEHRQYIAAADALLVLNELPDTQWRLLFTLSRWGGLRVGSEPRLMRWGDIAWDHMKLTVHSPKTEHHPGRATRVIPLFQEIIDALEDRLEVAEAAGEAGPGDLVLPFMRGRTDASLRKTLLSAIKRAGVKQWPRLWHNLRASRQTELELTTPGHVVCDWLGNTGEVASKHYLMTIDAHFASAVGERAHEKAQLQAGMSHDEGGCDTEAQGHPQPITAHTPASQRIPTNCPPV